MKRAPQEIFREVYANHFRGDERELRTAICIFAATLPRPERDILLQCDLGGRSAQSVGTEIGLCRRQVQRYRKSVRSKFVRYVTAGAAAQPPLEQLPALSHHDAHLHRRAEILAQSLRGEPAKATASRLGISVRTLWRERARIRNAQQDSGDTQGRERALNRVLGEVERAWFHDNYAKCATAAQAALAVARGIQSAGSENAALLHFRTYIWSEVIERTAGSARVADAYLAHARKAAAECSLGAHERAFLLMRELTHDLRNPGGYAVAYEKITDRSTAIPDLLADIMRAEIFDALELEKELALVLRRAATADVAAAPRNDVARTRIAVLGTSLRPEHERIARSCIANVRSWCVPHSRSFILADAYEAFLDARNGRAPNAPARLRAHAAHFRSAKLPGETATTLYLAARLAAENGDPRDAGACVEEALDAAEGRTGAKLYGELLRYSALSLGGRHRRRVAEAFTEAMRAAPLYMP